MALSIYLYGLLIFVLCVWILSSWAKMFRWDIDTKLMLPLEHFTPKTFLVYV